MPPKRFTEKIAANPFKNKNVGRRTGKDIKAGKIIRKNEKGFENFDDYWSESDADLTRDGTFVRPDLPVESTGEVTGKSISKEVQLPPQEMPSEFQDSIAISQQSVLMQSQISNIGPVKNALNPFRSKQIGRRTGKDMKAGRNIRITEGGFENFDDYWSESDADSIASFHVSTSSVKQRTSSVKRSSGPVSFASNTSTVRRDSTLTQPAQPGQHERHSTDDEALETQDTAEDSVSDRESQEDGQDQDDRQNHTQEDKQSPKDEQSQEDTQAQHQVGRTKPKQEVLQDEKAWQDQKQEHRRAPSHENQQDQIQNAQNSADFESQEEDFSERDGDDQDNRKENNNKTNQGKGSMNLQTTSNRKEIAETKRNTDTENDSEGEPAEDEDERGADKDEKTPGKNSRQEGRKSHGILLGNTKQTRPEDFSTEAQQVQSSTKRKQQGVPESERMTQEKEQAGKSAKTSQAASRQNREEAVNVDTSQTDSSEENDFEIQTGSDSQESSQEREQALTKQKVAAVSEEDSSQSNGSDHASDSGRSQHQGTTGEQSQASSSDTDVASSQTVAEDHFAVTNSQLHTQTSLSQMSTVASPMATSQKSSVYLSLAGDITGSITRLGNASALSPAPKLFGTRKKLSYAESPNKEQESLKAKPRKPRSNLPVPLTKTSSIKPASSPILEDHQEESHTTQNQQASSLPHIKDTTTETQGSAVQTVQRSDVEEVHSTITEVGTFLSLASQSQRKTNTTTAHSSLSESEDDEFEILDESPVYKGKTGRTKKGGGRKAAAAQGKSTTSTVVETSEGTTTNQKNRKISTTKSSSNEDEAEKFPAAINTQKGKKKVEKVPLKKFSSSNEEGVDSDAGTGTQQQMLKGKKKTGKKSTNEDQEEDSPLVTKGATKTLERKSILRKHEAAVSPCDGILQQETPKGRRKTEKIFRKQLSAEEAAALSPEPQQENPGKKRSSEEEAKGSGAADTKSSKKKSKVLARKIAVRKSVDHSAEEDYPDTSENEMVNSKENAVRRISSGHPSQVLHNEEATSEPRRTAKRQRKSKAQTKQKAIMDTGQKTDGKSNSKTKKTAKRPRETDNIMQMESENAEAPNQAKTGRGKRQKETCNTNIRD